MAVKYKNLVVQFNPTTVTQAQLQTALDTQANLGWQFVQAMLCTSSKGFALFIRVIAE